METSASFEARSAPSSNPTNLDRAPDMGCPAQWVERDGSRRSDGAIDDRCGSGRATFVPVMESADLGKCDDLASGRRLDRAGIRTVFI
jgi:hypothetical protein